MIFNDESRIESGLTAVESPNLLRKTLDMALNETIVRKQDIYSFFARSCGCKGREIVTSKILFTTQFRKRGFSKALLHPKFASKLRYHEGQKLDPKFR